MNELAIRDIHLPEAVSGWPPAIGWWLIPLIALLLAFALYKFIKYKRQHRKIAYKKIALKELMEISKKQCTHTETLREVSALLRRIALSYMQRKDSASLTGQKWIEQLNSLSSQPVFCDEISQLLIHGAYQPTLEFDPSVLISHCEKWIKLLPANAPTRNPI